DTTESPATFEVDPADPALRYVGRWNLDDPSLPSVGWQGASVALSFEGTAVDVHLDSGNQSEQYRVVVDGDHPGSTRFASAAGLQTYALADGLDLGEHEVELIKETYAGTDPFLHGFTVTGQGLLAAPETAPRHIEFYGDSNLAGHSLMSEQNQGGTALQGSHFTYAGITARAFGADYTNISVGGETLQGMTQLYDRQSWYDSQPSWDFATFPADAVVMNLGANDIYGASESTIRQRYVAMLDRLRAAHPDARIVVFNGWGWDADEPADYTADVVAEYGDPGVSAATFPWVFEQWHGCEYDHGGMARYLIAHMEDVLGWQATQPDVMSGFGLGGDVANGGFEEIAPFGGYGWRYYTDPGVSRVEDEAEAHGGDFFLRLTDGAAVHQPNPATDGDLVEVSLWLRGDDAGDTVDVTLDFRDQTMWTDPLDSSTETLTLTADWQSHTAQALAPNSPANPVVHTR
ncbi:MAG: GDSL-type esterase/lipase family protein, partial [Myxococcota bacterium]|nr:GDSL-type esterase/lipase family protein [Myxococcota bacterium]